MSVCDVVYSLVFTLHKYLLSANLVIQIGISYAYGAACPNEFFIMNKAQ